MTGFLTADDTRTPQKLDQTYWNTWINLHYWQCHLCTVKPYAAKSSSHGWQHYVANSSVGTNDTPCYWLVFSLVSSHSLILPCYELHLVAIVITPTFWCWFYNNYLDHHTCRPLVASHCSHSEDLEVRSLIYSKGGLTYMTWRDPLVL